MTTVFYLEGEQDVCRIYYGNRAQDFAFVLMSPALRYFFICNI